MDKYKNSYIFTIDGPDAFRPYLEKRLIELDNDTTDSHAMKEGRKTAVTDALNGKVEDTTDPELSNRNDEFFIGYKLESDIILKLVRYREDPNPIVLAVDFDNTIARTYNYPSWGELVPESVDWLLRWQKQGVYLILWTMRTGTALSSALDFCARHGITFWGVNENPSQVLYPHPASGKCFSHLLIDDTALGCPLDDKNAVDWSKMGPLASKAIEKKKYS